MKISTWKKFSRKHVLLVANRFLKIENFCEKFCRIFEVKLFLTVLAMFYAQNHLEP